jgi:hypothetical protein
MILPKRLGWILMLWVSLLAARGSDVLFDLSSPFFNIQPATNRVVRLSQLGPFANQFFYRTSDVSGQFYVSNATTAYAYTATILAPPSPVNFSFWCYATNLGIVNVTNLFALPPNAIQTMPAGQIGISFASALGLFQLNGATLSNTFYPLFSNPSNYINASTLDGTSNSLQSQIINGSITAATATNINNAAVGVIATNGAPLTYKFSASGTNSILAITQSLTNGLAAQKANTNAPTIWNPSIYAGSLLTNLNGNGQGMTNVAFFTTSNAGPVIDFNNNWWEYRMAGWPLGSGIQYQVGNNAEMLFVSSSNIDSFHIHPNGVFESSGNVIVDSELQVLDHFVSDDGAIASDAFGNLTANSFTGDGHSITHTSASNLEAQALGQVTNVVKFFTNNAATRAEVISATNTISAVISQKANTNGATLFSPSILGGSLIGDFNANGQGLTNANGFTTTNKGPLFRFNSGEWELRMATWPTSSGFFIGATNIGIDSSTAVSSLTVLPSGEVDILGPSLQVSGGLEVLDHFTSDGGAISSDSSGNLTAASFIGDGHSLTHSSASNLEAQALGQVTNVVNGLSSGGATSSLTNAIGTNNPNGALVNRTLFYPTNFDIKGGSNFLFGMIGTASNLNATANLSTSNFLQLEKVNSTNGFATGLNSTNTAILGNVSFGTTGQATNIISGTNYVYFVGAGSGIVSNGAFVWDSAKSVLTNWLNGAIITNNGTASLVQTNGVTLYSLAGTSPIGQYTAVNGALPAPSAYYTAALNDHMVMLGYWSVSNQLTLSNSIVTNITISTTNNFIANQSGLGTNTWLTNATLSSSAPDVNSVNNGGKWNFAALSAGQANTNTGSGYGAGVLSGTTNKINAAGAALIAGGTFNTINGGGGNAETIVGGAYNTLNGSAGISSVGGNLIGGGLSNAVHVVATASSILGGMLNVEEGGSYAVILGGRANTNLQDGAVILGGQTNRNNGHWSVAAGRNVIINHDNVFAWSDGVADTSVTNSQFRITATNGLYLNGPLWLGFANTNSGIFFRSNQFSLWAVTNSWGTNDFWAGSSNGVPVWIWNSNGTPVMKNIFP